MAVVLAGILFLLVGNTAAHAQTDWWDVLTNTPERLIGLLDLDDIVRGGCGPAPNRARARVYGAPSENAPAMGTLYWHEVPELECNLMIERVGGDKEVVPTLESGYEIPAAVVFERRGSWFRIRLAKGSAWIRRNDPTGFLPYPDMLTEQLAHVAHNWDGMLRETPSASGKAITLADGWKEFLDRAPSIALLGSRRVSGELWLHIKLITDEVCGQKLDGLTSVTGWLPAYRVNRAPAVWFSSRGC
jgi:hypothetical protein